MKPMGPNIVIAVNPERKVRSTSYEHNPEYAKNLNTHKWIGQFVRTKRFGSGGYMQWSHCSVCGMNYEMFKLQPLSCDQCIVKDILE